MATAAIAVGGQAKVKLPHLVSDGMVIQHSSDVRLWGWDKPGKKVTVTTSWSDETAQATTGKDGRWLVSVKSPAASFTPLEITFDDGEKTTVKNVLAGEVWVCAGQSNMEMTVRGFDMCPVVDYNNEVLDAAGGINIKDESLGIDWRIPIEKAILSEKDLKHACLKDFDSPFSIDMNLY